MGDIFDKMATPWKTSDLNQDRTRTVILSMVVLIAFIYLAQLFLLYGLKAFDPSVAVPKLIEIVISQSILLYMGIFLGLGLIIMNDRDMYAGLGKPTPMPILAGVGLAVILLLFKVAGAHFTQTAIISQESLEFIANVIVNPFAEELIFGSILIFALHRIGFNSKIAFFITCMLFALYHWFATGANYSSMGFSFVFRALILYGNAQFRTSTFGMALHWALNLMLILGGTST